MQETTQGEETLTPLQGHSLCLCSLCWCQVFSHKGPLCYLSCVCFYGLHTVLSTARIELTAHRNTENVCVFGLFRQAGGTLCV